MILIYFFGFFTTVSIFAIITNRLNQKEKCNHNWEDKGDGVLKCSKCNKNIKQHGNYDNEHLAT